MVKTTSHGQHLHHHASPDPPPEQGSHKKKKPASSSSPVPPSTPTIPPLLDALVTEIVAVTGAGTISKTTDISKSYLSHITPHRVIQGVKTLVLCLLYLCIGPALILLNKHILKDLDNGTGFNFPMFLSCLGLICSSLTAHIAVKVFGSKLPNQKTMTLGFYLTHAVPVGFCQALTLGLGNSAYVYLTVSFIQMLKAFTPVMVLIVGGLFLVEVPETRIIITVLGICAGTAIASYGEVAFSVLGILTMGAAEFTEATRLVLVQSLLHGYKFGIIESQYYLAPAGAVCLMTASILTEFRPMYEVGAFAQVLAHPWLFFLAGTLGIGVHFMSFLVVQLTSSVTLKVLGTARNAFLVLFSVYFYKEVVTSLQLTGYMISISFFMLYSYYKTVGAVAGGGQGGGGGGGGSKVVAVDK